MRLAGVIQLTTDERVDAGYGRRLWLATNLRDTETAVDLGGTGSMFVGWHDHVTSFDDLSGFGPGHRLWTPFVQGDVQCLPFAAREFDVAVLAEVLEHVPDPVQALREAARVSSRVLITTPIEGLWRNPNRFRIPGHLRFYTPDLFAAQCRRAEIDGVLSILEFGTWAFLVGVLSSDGTVEDCMLKAAA